MNILTKPITDAWNRLSPRQRLRYAPLAARWKTTLFQAYTRHNLRRLLRPLPILHRPPD